MVLHCYIQVKSVEIELFYLSCELQQEVGGRGQAFRERSRRGQEEKPFPV